MSTIVESDARPPLIVCDFCNGRWWVSKIELFKRHSCLKVVSPYKLLTVPPNWIVIGEPCD